MSLSSGHRTLLGEVASWVVVAGVLVAAVTHFDQLKSIAHRIAGTDPADLQMAASGEVGQIDEVTSPDDNLQAVFTYLVK